MGVCVARPFLRVFEKKSSKRVRALLSRRSLYDAPPPAAVSGAADARSPAMRVRLRTAPGSHLTMLTQDVFLPGDVARGVISTLPNPDLTAPRAQWLKQVDGALDDLKLWLDDDISP